MHVPASCRLSFTRMRRCRGVWGKLDDDAAAGESMLKEHAESMVGQQCSRYKCELTRLA